jgi:HlyD family secretion protein
MWKVLIAIVVTAGVVGGTAFWLTRGTAESRAEESAVEVRVEETSRGDLVEFVTAPGQSVPLMKVQISSRIAARVLELPFKEGDRVTRGGNGRPPSMLVKLDSSELEARLTQAEARYAAQQSSLEVAEVRIQARESEIASAQVQFDDAARDLGRQKSLLATGDVSQVVVDAAQVKFDQLRNQLEGATRGLQADRGNLAVLRHELTAAEAQISQVREELGYAVITSPIEGTVTRVNAEAGELAVTGTMNNAGTVIMEVSDLSRMLIEARVDESAIASVRVGQRAVARSIAYPGKEFRGTVKTVALSKTTAAEAASRGRGGGDGQAYFETQILLDEGQEILAGVSADVEIEVLRHKGVLRVPSQAIMGRSTDELPEVARARPEVDATRTVTAVVFVKNGRKAVLRPVRIGAADLTHTIIESGLEEGETIVTGPYKALEGMQHDAVIKLAAGSTQPATRATQPAIGASQPAVSSTQPAAGSTQPAGQGR